MLKEATTKIQQSADAVTKEIKGVVDDTTRLIREREQAKQASGPFDSIDDERSASTTTTTVTPEEHQPAASAEPHDTVKL